MPNEGRLPVHDKLAPAEVHDEREIKYPILDIHALGPEIKDLKHLLSPEEQSGFGVHDKVVAIHIPDIAYPTETPSAIVAIKELTKVESLYQIGAEGPSIASLSIEENRTVEAVRRYEVVHGRDALRVAFDLHDQYPGLMRSTILSLAEQQGLIDEESDYSGSGRQEERGKIMLLNRDHEDDDSQRFRKEKGWEWPFYGSIDATPSFIISIASHLNREPDLLNLTFKNRHGEQSSIKESLDMAVDWLLAHTKKTTENPEGLLEFINKAPRGKGILNQAWKDSDGAYVHADGSWANHDKGIASVEVQGLAYDACIYAAQIYRNLGEDSKADELEQRAGNLKKMVLEKFWVEDERGGYFALGTDRDEQGNLRVMKVRSSNMGQLLATQLLKDDDPAVRTKVEATVKTLFSPEMLSRWGIRTLSNLEKAFRKEGYHVGSVWLWDNDAVGAGLENHGYHGLARYLWGLSLEVIDKTKMFPEFIQGGDNDETPVLNKREIYVWDDKEKTLHLWEQLPQQIQAWSVSSALATKRRNFLVQLHHAIEPAKLKLENSLLKGLPKIELYR